MRIKHDAAALEAQRQLLTQESHHKHNAERPPQGMGAQQEGTPMPTNPAVANERLRYLAQFQEGVLAPGLLLRTTIQAASLVAHTSAQILVQPGLAFRAQGSPDARDVERLLR